MATALSGKGISSEKAHDLIERAKNYAILNGVCMRTSEQPGLSETVNYAPFTLFPTVVPRQGLEEVKKLQTTFNLLMHKVASNHAFLERCLHNVIKVDDFTRRLWGIYTAVREEGITQPLSLGLFRNDFMMDVGDCDTRQKNQKQITQAVKFKQIEFNTIASSFGGLVSGLTDVHRYNLIKAGAEFDDKQLPKNKPSYELARGIVKAWELYRPTDKTAILFLVGKPERNALDQILLERQVFLINPKIPVLYKSLQELSTQANLDQNQRLMVCEYDIAVVYFRDGYAPNHYHTDKDWNTRLLIERSMAIKCPSVSYQLAGTKKIQQELARSGALECFISDSHTRNMVQKLFAGQYTLDKGTEGDEAIRQALENPGRFVLKPQREGGGNNLYDGELKEMLLKIRDSDERSAYILMEKIYPWIQKNYLIKYGEVSSLGDVVSEVGIYGILIGRGPNDIIENSVGGHLMRTKALGVNEGGVATGFATLDTPFLAE